MDLQERLGLLPPDLENLYQKILDSLDPFYYEHAFQYFHLVRSAEEPLTLLTLSFADEAPEYVFNCPIGFLNSDATIYRAEQMRRRLNSRCKGLLEIEQLQLEDSPAVTSTYPANSIQDSQLAEGIGLAVSGPMQPVKSDSFRKVSGTLTEIRDPSRANSTVQYLHRTVKDFLEDPQVWTKLRASSKGDFDPYIALCRSYLTQLKVQPIEPVQAESFLLHNATKCLTQASLCEKHSDPLSLQKDLIPVLDELDCAATQIWNTFTRPGKPAPGMSVEFVVGRNPLWYIIKGRLVCYITQGHLGTIDSLAYRAWKDDYQVEGSSFLSLAVNIGLYHYIEAKVPDRCLEIHSGSVRPLLADAIKGLPTDPCNRYYQERIPQTRMVRLLLSNSADPNYRLGSSTVWKDMLLMLQHLSNSSRAVRSNIASYWLLVVVEFLEHGADPSVDLDSSLVGLYRFGDEKTVNKIRSKQSGL